VMYVSSLVFGAAESLRVVLLCVLNLFNMYLPMFFFMGTTRSYCNLPAPTRISIQHLEDYFIA